MVNLNGVLSQPYANTLWSFTGITSWINIIVPLFGNLIVKNTKTGLKMRKKIIRALSNKN